MWTVPYKLYKDQLVDQAALMLTVFGRVTETKQALATRFNFRLRTPDIILTVSPQMSPIFKSATYRLQNLKHNLWNYVEPSPLVCC